METFLIKAVQLILSLSILVIIHECGHFMFAKIFKIRVEKFYLFFNPWFSIFKFKPKNSETEYGIGWVPLGGYVKIAGMIDESMDKDQMNLPAQPWEFRSKPSIQRLLVMVGGVLFNFILAIIIYSMMLFIWGDNYISLKNVSSGMEFSQSVKDAGFKDRDVLVSADGHELALRGGVMDMNTLMNFLDAKSVVVKRNGVETVIHPPAGFATQVIASQKIPYDKWIPTTIGQVVDTMSAKKAGLLKGDSIVAINNVPVASFSQMGVQLSNNIDKIVTIKYIRNRQEFLTNVSVGATGRIGVMSVDMSKYYKIERHQYNFFTSFPKGINIGVQTLKAYVSQIRFLFTKKGVKKLSGFGGIGSMFPPIWDWHSFWVMTAFLSIVLAFMNILPIPALDGGHILFLLYEMITRRKPNDKVMEYAQMTGMAILLLLLVYANGNDIIRLIFK